MDQTKNLINKQINAEQNLFTGLISASLAVFQTSMQLKLGAWAKKVIK